MKKNLFRYLKHISLTILVLAAIAIVVGLNIGAAVHYGDHPLMMIIDKEEVEKGLNKFNAKLVVVEHTLQSKVNRLFNGKVIGIDVKHTKDYQKNFPNQESEGLLIEGDAYYRVLADGEREEI